MAFPRSSLRAFLAHAKSSLATAIQQSQKVTLVIGNESADLDSLTSSLLYAYFRSLSPPTLAFTPLYIPLLCIPSGDLPLRPEFPALLQHANLSPSHLITLSDLPPPSHLRSSLKPETTRFVLVDHNSLPPFLSAIYPPHLLHGVIDHHEDEHAVPPDTDPEPRIIQPCGSCTSLVTHFCRPAWSALSPSAAHRQGESPSPIIDDSAVVATWDAQIAKLALASVLIDTANLSAPGKVEAVDREAVEFLEGRILASAARVEAQTWDRAGFYGEIERAKRDIGGLGLRDVLRKDYKGWREGEGGEVGISSVVRGLGWMVGKAGDEGLGKNEGEAFDAVVGRFMEERALIVYAIMTADTAGDGEFRRELLLQARGEGRGKAEKFVQNAGKELGLEAWVDARQTDGDDEELKPVDGRVWRKVWRQMEVGKSRKQVAPLLRSAMR